MKIETANINDRLWVENDKQKIQLNALSDRINILLDGYYFSSISFESLYKLLSNTDGLLSLQNQLTGKDELIGKLTLEKVKLETELATYKILVDNLKTELKKVEKPEKIDLGELFITNFFGADWYCLSYKTQKYVCRDGSLQKGGEDHPYYHESRESLMKILDENYIYGKIS